MPRDNNPTHDSSDDESTTRDNMPTTHKRSGRSTDADGEVCPVCGSVDWRTKPVPDKDADGGSRTADVCRSCGYVTPPDEPTNADKA